MGGTGPSVRGWMRKANGGTGVSPVRRPVAITLPEAGLSSSGPITQPADAPALEQCFRRSPFDSSAAAFFPPGHLQQRFSTDTWQHKPAKAAKLERAAPVRAESPAPNHAKAQGRSRERHRAHRGLASRHTAQSTVQYREFHGAGCAVPQNRRLPLH